MASPLTVLPRICIDLVVSCRVVSCRVVSCRVLSCLVLSLCIEFFCLALCGVAGCPCSAFHVRLVRDWVLSCPCLTVSLCIEFFCLALALCCAARFARGVRGVRGWFSCLFSIGLCLVLFSIGCVCVSCGPVGLYTCLSYEPMIPQLLHTNFHTKGNQQAPFTGMNPVADANNFLVLYPEGEGTPQVANPLPQL